MQSICKVLDLRVWFWKIVYSLVKDALYIRIGISWLCFNSADILTDGRMDGRTVLAWHGSEWVCLKMHIPYKWMEETRSGITWLSFKSADILTDRRTVGQTDWRTDGQTGGWTVLSCHDSEWVSLKMHIPWKWMEETRSGITWLCFKSADILTDR